MGFKTLRVEGGVGVVRDVLRHSARLVPAQATPGSILGRVGDSQHCLPVWRDRGRGLRLSSAWGAHRPGSGRGAWGGEFGSADCAVSLLSLLWPEACQAAFSISSSSFSFLASLRAFGKKWKGSSRNVAFPILKCTIQ